MIRVCDAIMGSGKTQSAIRYMNDHPNDKFIYITPYLDEACRIKSECSRLNFVEPSNKISEFNFSKTQHTLELVKRGKNIASTHQAFKFYTKETLKYIKDMGYVLFIDENVDVLEKFVYSSNDLRVALDGGYVIENDGIYTVSKDKDYEGIVMHDLFRLMSSRDLIEGKSKKHSELFFWTLPKELLTSFKDVFIMTYLFESQSLYYFMKINNIPYELIGVVEVPGGYMFGEHPGYAPEYIYDLKNKIHIFENKKLNAIGDDYYSLSMNWFESSEDNVKRLKNNMYNYFHNFYRMFDTNKRLWASFNKEFVKLRGKGYTKCFLSFNTKATNNYSDKKVLVYAVNLFMNVNEKIFYKTQGIEVDEDKYALSIMIQWIWRSAIRNGEDIYVYIPSKRMRHILRNWINTLDGRQ